MILTHLFMHDLRVTVTQLTELVSRALRVDETSVVRSRSHRRRSTRELCDRCAVGDHTGVYNSEIKTTGSSVAETTQDVAILFIEVNTSHLELFLNSERN